MERTRGFHDMGGWRTLLLGIMLYFLRMTGVSQCLEFSPGAWKTEVLFSNSSGTTLPCIAVGFPRPTLQWILTNASLGKSRLYENTEAQPLSRNSTSRPFRIFPFSPSEFSSSIHSNTYQCVATNPSGTIVSPPIRVRAVMDTNYDLQVFPSYAYAQNIAVLKCLIPPFVKDFLRVESWLFGSLAIISRGRYSIFPERGELHIRNVSTMDEAEPYRCVGQHLLTGKKTVSSTSGRLTIQSRSSSVPLRMEKSYIPKEIRVYAGESVEVPCVAVSLPPPNYKWFHHSSGSSSALVAGVHFFVMGGSLLLREASLSHGGTWTCRASSGGSRAEESVSLSVLSMPSLVLSPQRQRVDLGVEARISCAFGGSPLLGVFWTKNGGRISSLAPRRGKIIRGKNASVLLIHSMDLDDRGQYQCFVQGETTTLVQSSNLELGNSKAILVSSFDHQVHQPGSSVSLSCEASGSPSPNIFWTLDGSSLPLRPSESRTGTRIGSKLEIHKITLSQGGFYSCIARNELGESIHSQRVDVVGEPFVRPMGPLSLLSGSNVSIGCPYSGYPIVDIRWTKNGEVLPLNERQRVLEKNASLFLQNIQPIDRGEYSCSVTNKRGKSARENFELTVAIPPRIEPFTFKEDLQVGGRIRISCTASVGDLPIKFEWFFNNHRLLEGDHSNGISINTVDVFSSSLVIPKLKTDHSGNFSCIASNSAASDTYSSSLIVNVPLSWIVAPSDNVIMKGDSVVMNCLVNGVPPPTISWHKEVNDNLGTYSPLSEVGIRHKIYSNGSLALSKAVGEDDGTYLCKAENGISEQGLSKLARLVVNVPAHFSDSNINQTGPVGSRSVLLCPVLGNNPITVYWSRNQASLSPSEHMSITEEESSTTKSLTSKLVIRNLHRDDSGLFQCTASNLFGKAVRSIHLIVQEPPEVPVNPLIVSYFSRNANVSWEHPYDGRSPIGAYIIEFKLEKEASSWEGASSHIVSGSSKWAQLQSLAPSTSYEIRLLAKNTVGTSGVSKVLRLRTKEEIPGGPPIGVRGTANGSQSIVVTWRPPLSELRHGVILGYYLGYKVMNSSEPFRYQTLEMKYRRQRTRETLELVLYHLKKYTEYSIVVQAYNALGAGPRNPAIQVRTDEDVPSGPPGNVACTPLSSTGLLILWSPPREMNGHLKDYRVTYRPLREWEDSVPVRDVVTTQMKIAIYELDKFQNYTIQVVASTRIGEGLRSRSIYCRTKEDVPGPPENIKALSLDQYSILVSWLPPASPNGRISHHSVFMKTMEGGRQFTQNFKVYPPATTYTIRGLNQNQPYSFWVSSSTSVGRGVDSEIVTETPSLPIPASIASFSRTVFGAVGEEMIFPCISIGAPDPRTSWTFNGEAILHQSRLLIDSTRDNSLWITALDLGDSGNYSCSVSNHFGSDSVVYYLTVKKSRNNGVPPAPPTLSVISTTPSTITLGWSPSADGGSPLLGYRLHHHREFGDWDRIDINPANDSYTLSNLRCGSHYQFYLQGVNDFGVGERTETVSARTRGSSPLAPLSEEFISVNSTSIILRLDAWRNGGCPISSFVVEYKKADSDSHWILVNNNVKMNQEKTFAVLDLSPQTPYALRLTAHNSAGSTIEEYNFITLTFTGATIAPELIIHSEYGGMSFLLSPGFLFSFFSVILVSVLIGVALRLRWALCRRGTADNHGGNGRRPSHLCVNNSESDKQIILPMALQDESSRNLSGGDYLMEEGYVTSTMGRKKPYGKPIILQHHHHHVHHPGSNFYSEEAPLDPGSQDHLSESPGGFYTQYTLPREHQGPKDDKGESDSLPGSTEGVAVDGNWIPLTHLIGAQRL